MSRPQPTVAIAGEFLEAFAAIPRAQQKKVREFTEKFRLDPTSASINYEKLKDVRDPKVRTVRIGIDYRAVIIQPEEGNVYLLVWVDKHDEAMAWARSRVFEINPVTGALQVVPTTVEAPSAPKPKAVKGLFAQFADGDLLGLGVPQALMPAVRAVAARDELEALCRHLPAEAAESLIWLDEGMPLDEVRDAATAASRPKVDARDFQAALKHPDTKRRFAAVETNDELSAMLRAPLSKWRVFLHPSQERLVSKEFAGPAKVTGGAGTGKTVVAMHRARYLAGQLFRQDTDRILFTTFTANLAGDIEANLKVLGGSCLERVEVVHLHAWAARLLRSQGQALEIISQGEEQHRLWQTAIHAVGCSKWDPGFFESEWRDVVMAQGLATREEYLKASRRGRGRTVSRPDRAEIWKVFEEYRSSLRRSGKMDWLDVVHEARRLLEGGTIGLPYRAVVVDEAQDLHAEEWRLIRAIVPSGTNDLFLVGDAHQRIYGRAVTLSSVGINVRGRSHRLKVNYRTTRQIKDWAMAILRPGEYDDLDGAREELKGYVSLLKGAPPVVKVLDSFDAEVTYLVATIKEHLQQRRACEVCVTARTNDLVDKYQRALAAKGVSSTKVTKEPHLAGDDCVHIATMHRLKGLEYPVVLIAGAQSIPLPLRDVGEDAVAAHEHEAWERSLLFVAATRAREALVVTSAGEHCGLLQIT